MVIGIDIAIIAAVIYTIKQSQHLASYTHTKKLTQLAALAYSYFTKCSLIYIPIYCIYMYTYMYACIIMQLYVSVIDFHHLHHQHCHGC